MPYNMFLLPLAASSPYYAYYAYSTSDMMGKSVVIVLFLFSIFTWTVMIEKWISLYRAKKASHEFSMLFRQKKYPLSIVKTSLRYQGPVAKIYEMGVQDLLAFYNISPENAEFYGSEKYPEQKLTTGQIETVRSTMERGVSDQILKLEDRVPLLATAVSLSPFLGLFGTVWGVMIAFCAMALQGKADIGSMAPGIAGALLTTVVGLVVAIPSLVGYNLITVTIREITVNMDNFVEEFMAKVKLEQH